MQTKKLHPPSEQPESLLTTFILSLNRYSTPRGHTQMIILQFLLPLVRLSENGKRVMGRATTTNC